MNVRFPKNDKHEAISTTNPISPIKCGTSVMDRSPQACMDLKVYPTSCSTMRQASTDGHFRQAPGAQRYGWRSTIRRRWAYSIYIREQYPKWVMQSFASYAYDFVRVGDEGIAAANCLGLCRARKKGLPKPPTGGVKGLDQAQGTLCRSGRATGMICLSLSGARPIRVACLRRSVGPGLCR
jgi:hypothetical protein